MVLTSPFGACTMTRGTSFSCPLGDLAPGQRTSVAFDLTLAHPADERDLTVRLTGTDGDASVASKYSLPLRAEGPDCTVIGRYGADVVRGTAGDDVLCGPSRPLGSLARVVPGAGDDIIRGGALLDYSGAPGPIKDVGSGSSIRLTGWGDDQVQWLHNGQASFDDQRASVIGSAFDDVFGPRWTSVAAGPGKDTVWIRSGQRTAGTVVDGGPGVDVLKLDSGPHLDAFASLSDPYVRNFEQLLAGGGDDELVGNAGWNVVRGGAPAGSRATTRCTAGRGPTPARPTTATTSSTARRSPGCRSADRRLFDGAGHKNASRSLSLQSTVRADKEARWRSRPWAGRSRSR
jgi:hypothetical protein